MDAIDEAILGELVRDARVSFSDLGRRVGLSANAVAERVRKLQRTGVITAFTALVDPAAGGDSIEGVVDVRIAPDLDGSIFERNLAAMPAVIEVLHLTGRSDYQLRMRCRDAAELDATLRTLKRSGVVQSETRIVLSTIVQRR